MYDLGYTYEYRTQQYHIRKNHKMYKLLDELTFKAKNLYNKALYLERQCYYKAAEKVQSNFVYVDLPV